MMMRPQPMVVLHDVEGHVVVVAGPRVDIT
jgi:hypothetical protein